MIDEELLRKWTAGFLKIASEVLRAAEITRTLGIEPTHVRVQGVAARTTATGASRPVTTLWLLESGVPSTAPLEDHVVALMEKIEGRVASLDVLAKHCKQCFSLGFAAANGQGGPWFDHAVVERIARVPVDMTIHLFPPFVDIWQVLAEEPS